MAARGVAFLAVVGVDSESVDSTLRSCGRVCEEEEEEEVGGVVVVVVVVVVMGLKAPGARWPVPHEAEVSIIALFQTWIGDAMVG